MKVEIIKIGLVLSLWNSLVKAKSRVVLKLLLTLPRLKVYSFNNKRLAFVMSNK